MKKLFYEYIIQEQINDMWFDKYTSTDRRFIEEAIKVFRNKYKSKFRVVRLVL